MPVFGYVRAYGRRAVAFSATCTNPLVAGAPDTLTAKNCPPNCISTKVDHSFLAESNVRPRYEMTNGLVPQLVVGKKMRQ